MKYLNVNPKNNETSLAGNMGSIDTIFNFQLAKSLDWLLQSLEHGARREVAHALISRQIAVTSSDGESFEGHVGVALWDSRGSPQLARRS